MEDEVLNLSSALEMLGGEKDLLIELFKAFIEAEPFEEKKLLQLEEKEDTKEAAKYIHYFKGAARQIGAEKLAKSGQALEDVLRKKKDGDVKALNKVFIEDYLQATKAIASAIDIL